MIAIHSMRYLNLPLAGLHYSDGHSDSLSEGVRHA
jgi:hypothetical protein